MWREKSFKGLNIDCIQYSNIIRITHYSYSYSGTILNPNIIRIRIRPNICARILFVFVFAHSEKPNTICIRIRSKFWFRIIFVFVFGPKNGIRSPLVLDNVNFIVTFIYLFKYGVLRQSIKWLGSKNIQHSPPLKQSKQTKKWQKRLKHDNLLQFLIRTSYHWSFITKGL